MLSAVKGVQANKRPFFKKCVAKKHIHCPQCLEWPCLYLGKITKTSDLLENLHARYFKSN